MTTTLTITTTTTSRAHTHTHTVVTEWCVSCCRALDWWFNSSDPVHAARPPDHIPSQPDAGERRGALQLQRRGRKGPKVSAHVSENKEVFPSISINLLNLFESWNTFERSLFFSVHFGHVELKVMLLSAVLTGGQLVLLQSFSSSHCNWLSWKHSKTCDPFLIWSLSPIWMCLCVYGTRHKGGNSKVSGRSCPL